MNRAGMRLSSGVTDRGAGTEYGCHERKAQADG